MLRAELLHPAFIHFPIVFLFLLPIFKGLSLGVKQKQKEFRYLYLASLCLGLITYFISIYLGDIALDAVKEDVCQFQRVHQHEDMAYYCLFSFLGALVLELLIESKKIPLIKLLNCLCLLVLLIGNYLLIKTAHLGGQLVYDHGIGTKDNHCRSK